MLITLERGREAAKGAALPCILAVCTDERRHDPGRSEPPQRSTETENCQGKGPRTTLFGARGTVCPGETELFSLYEDELGETRRDRLAGVGPQGTVLQHAVEQIVAVLRWCRSSMFMCRR